MRCEAAQLEISARMDGAEDRSLRDAVDAHAAGCVACRAFAQGAGRLRVLTRLEAAPPVPDLVPRIMSHLSPQPRRTIWLPAAAAFVAGAVAGAVLVGGLPAIRRGPDPALATEVPERIAVAAAHVTSYRATFEIVERSFHPEVPVRRMMARVGFTAPERFRAQIRDRSAYPSAAWPRNDVLLDVDRERWTLRGPATCPREALPVCAPGGVEARTVTGREPFDGQAPVPTDIVLPLRSLAGSDRVRVAGSGEVLGRETIEVDMAYRDATPLFGFLHAGGAWRPLFPLDRVRVSLASETWFPLSFRVFPSPDPEREAWAVRNGLPLEPPAQPVLEVTATSLDTATGPRGSARAASTVRVLGFEEAPFHEAATDVPLPDDVAGLRPYRAGRAGRTTVLALTRGLSWLKVRGTRGWRGPEPFGLAGGPWERIALPGAGPAAYQPATATHGRRIAVHSPTLDLVLESNLPRARLEAVASSLPVPYRPPPASWEKRPVPGGTLRPGVPVARARAAFPALLLPGRLPFGYRVASIDLVETTETTAVTVHAWRPGTELDGVGIVLHQSSIEELPPPMEPDVASVTVRGTTGRYSSTRGELEWIEAGVYRSLRSGTLGLADLLDVARGLSR